MDQDDGTARAWGYNGRGQLGDGTTDDSSSPVEVSGLTDVTSVGVGNYFTLATTGDGAVWAWGTNTYGELGDGSGEDSSTPVEVAGLP